MIIQHPTAETTCWSCFIFHPAEHSLLFCGFNLRNFRMPRESDQCGGKIVLMWLFMPSWCWEISWSYHCMCQLNWDDFYGESGDDACNEIVDQTEPQCSDLPWAEHDQPIALSWESPLRPRRGRPRLEREDPQVEKSLTKKIWTNAKVMKLLTISKVKKNLHP